MTPRAGAITSRAVVERDRKSRTYYTVRDRRIMYIGSIYSIHDPYNKDSFSFKLDKNNKPLTLRSAELVSLSEVDGR
jgi:hypothetical protein